MIKNIILDIGGVLFDDTKETTDKILNKDSSEFCDKVFGDNFKKCIRGDISLRDYTELFQNDPDYQDIKYMLDSKNMNVTYPMFDENIKYVYSLKDKGYKLYLLTNISDDHYSYIKSKIDIDHIFTGGIYSCQEHLIKPDKRIYELIINKYNLKKEECIFFDDKEVNVDAANDCGIKSVVFKKIDDIKRNI